MNKLLLSLLLVILANIGTWFQFQGQFWSDKIIFKSPYYVMIVGALLSPIFWHATKFSYEHFGFTWNIRMIGFGMGTLVFGIMSYLFLKEIPTMKTIV